MDILTIRFVFFIHIFDINPHRQAKMTPSFIAFINKSGIVCAADTDHTIFQLSTEHPFALAVNPSSRFPWKGVVKDYLLMTKGKPENHELFEMNVADFELFLAEKDIRSEWYDLADEESAFVLMGYGKDDLFPSIYEAKLRVSQDGLLGFEDPECFTAGYGSSVKYSLLGNFDNMLPLLCGATDKTATALYECGLSAFEIYRNRILEKFKGTGFEEFVTERLDEFDEDEAVISNIDYTTGKIQHDLSIGVGTFSIEDLVSSVETIINANARLRYLREGGRGEQVSAKEIAVITRHKGEELTWCKHSLYAL